MRYSTKLATMTEVEMKLDDLAAKITGPMAVRSFLGIMTAKATAIIQAGDIKDRGAN